MGLMLLAAIVAGLAAVIGALLPHWRRPSTLISSIALGFAAGVMLGTVAFEIVPEALHLSSLTIASFGFAAGFAIVYGFDLFVHRGQVAGEHSKEHEKVEAAHQRHRPLGGPTTVLGGGMLFEASIEGLSLGVATAIGSGLTLPLAAAVAIDNFTEGLSLGALASNGQSGQGRATLRWAVATAVATVLSSIAGWFVLRSLPSEFHAAVFAAGGGGMLYLTITQLVPEAEAEHYQHSSAVAAALGFLAILVLSEVRRTTGQ